MSRQSKYPVRLPQTWHVYETLEAAAIHSFDPPLSARVRSHIVEAARGEGKPDVFCLEDSTQEQ